MSNANTAVSEKKGLQIDWKQTARLSLTLLIITAIAAFILSLVNAITADTIAEHAAAKRQEAMVSVIPGADVFSQLYSENETIIGITGAYAGTQFKGYCVEVAPNGFGGAISLMVGINEGGSVTGAAILDHSETAGLGSKAENPEFLTQFTGKSGTITVNSGNNAINAITGATITSKAVTEGINTALTAVLNYDAEGGQLIDDGEV